MTGQYAYWPDKLSLRVLVGHYWSIKRGSSVVKHLPLVLEVPGSIPCSWGGNFQCSNTLCLVSFAGMTLDRCSASISGRFQRCNAQNRLGKSLKATIKASFSYNSFKQLANWSLEDMFFGNTFKSRRVALSPFYTTHENMWLMSAVSYFLPAPSWFLCRKHCFDCFLSKRRSITIKDTDGMLIL